MNRHFNLLPGNINPSILEVSYSTENVSNDIVNLIRNLNEGGELTSNIITTHTTISHNTEVFLKNQINEDDDTSQEVESNSTDSSSANQSASEPSSSSETINDMCVICRCDMGDTDILRKIKKCGHYFHINCLDRWLESKITCPTCRCDIRLNINEDQSNSASSN